MALLEVEDLRVRFYTEAGVVTAVDGVSYRIERGETFGVVGESGAGKSVTARSLMRLVDPPGRIEDGEVRFDGRNVLDLPEEEVRRLRGDRIAMVFQDAGRALNPVYTVGEQIAEAIRLHLGYDAAAARERTIELLDRVGISDPAERYSDYPHQFSGGMKQRVVIAMAISCEPDLLICDEPTSALDVTIEAGILDLLDDLASEFDTAVQLISHDLGVVAERCDRVMVMYAGRTVETASVDALYYDPKHPYTVGLLSSIPRIGADRDRLRAIPGTMPDPIQLPPGCSFHPRCPYAEEACVRAEPELVDPETGITVDAVEADRAAACLAYAGEMEGDLGFVVHVDEPTAEPDSTVAVPGASNPQSAVERRSESGGDTGDPIDE